MLKYVVPVYLIAIFTMFCVKNVPSTDGLAATIDSQYASELAEGPPSAAILASMAEKKVEWPKGAVLRPDADGTSWAAAVEDGAPTLILRTSADGVAVYRHKAGYLENTMANHAAFMSVLFIAIIVAFLMLLAHIAGRRWEAEGRLNFGP
jgi:hypothetical protein